MKPTIQKISPHVYVGLLTFILPGVAHAGYWEVAIVREGNTEEMRVETDYSRHIKLFTETKIRNADGIESISTVYNKVPVPTGEFGWLNGASLSYHRDFRGRNFRYRPEKIMVVAQRAMLS